jgi:predicted RNase H-like HicB family nuclease
MTNKLSNEKVTYFGIELIMVTRAIEAIMNFSVEVEREDDGRWIAEVLELPGVLVYGQTREEAIAKVQALALHVVADRLEHSEATPEFMSVSFIAA